MDLDKIENIHVYTMPREGVPGERPVTEIFSKNDNRIDFNELGTIINGIAELVKDTHVVWCSAGWSEGGSSYADISPGGYTREGLHHLIKDRNYHD